MEVIDSLEIDQMARKRSVKCVFSSEINGNRFASDKPLERGQVVYDQ